MIVPRRIVVASKNPDKVSEIEAVLQAAGLGIEIVRGLDWPDVEETGSTLEENAALKANAVLTTTGLAALADDTGLEVVALGGAPGVHTARFASPTASYEDNVARLLADLEGIKDRRATFRTVVVLASPQGREVMAEGRLEGTIVHAPRGDFGFGYDPVFEVSGRTLGEMTTAEKNQLSHRARALQSLTRELGS